MIRRGDTVTTRRPETEPYEAPLEEWRRAVRRSSDDVLRALRDVLDVDAIQVVPAECWNGVFQVSGSGGAYCLKVMNEATSVMEWSSDDLDYVGAVVHGLTAAGVCGLIPPFRFPDGSYSTRAAGYRVVVFPWREAIARIRAAASHDSRAMAAMGGRMLHEVHQGGLSVAREHGERPSRWPRHLSAGRFLERADEIWEATERKLAAQRAARETMRQLWNARHLVDRLATNGSRLFSPAAEVTVLHGDFRPENLVFGAGRVEFVYDWDFLHTGIAEEDLAYAALYLSGPSWFSGGRDWGIVATFVRSYQERAAELRVGAVDAALLTEALKWTVAKELGMSDMAELVPGRYRLFQEIREHAYLIAEACA